MDRRIYGMEERRIFYGRGRGGKADWRELALLRV
jgi:hypothetical protein